MVVGQTLFQEFFAAIRHLGLLREKHFASIQNCLITHDSHLRFIVTKRLHSVKKFVKNHTNGPNIDLAGNFRIPQIEAFRSLIPIRTNPLRSQFNFILSLLKSLTKSKISDFDLTFMEQYILRLQIVMYNPLFLIVQVLHSTQNLWNDQLSLFFSNRFVFF